MFCRKIADFGYSIVESTELNKIFIGGTQPWKAPEAQRSILAKSLYATDTYSLGLLIWLVCIDGKDPFDLVINESMQGKSRVDAIDALKQSDELLTIACSQRWLRDFLARMHKSRLEPLIEREKKANSAVNASSTQKSVPSRSSEAYDSILDGIFEATCRARLVRSIEHVFDHSIQLDPEKERP